MKFPNWVQDEIARFVPPTTGRVTIALEFYVGGISKLEISPTIRITPKSRSNYDAENEQFRSGKLAGTPVHDKDE